MLNLTTTTALLRVSPVATCDLQCWVSWVDDDRSKFGVVDEFVPSSTPTLITTATANQTICGSPASGVIRNIKFASLRNAHASTLVTFDVNITNGTTAIKLQTLTLLAGEMAVLADSGVFFVYDVNGAVKAGTGPGRLLKSTILTTGTSFVTTSLTTSIRVRVQGGGGGGGGCTSVAAAAAAAGGGGAGAYAERLFTVIPSTAYAYTIGAAGAGVSGAAGNNGGSSTFVVGGVTVTAPGGTGAPVATAATTLTNRAGGAGGVLATNGDWNAGGAPGEYGSVLIVATPILASGNGGSCIYGAGGLGIVAVGNGNNAAGFGAGGGGSATGASAVRTGGNGGAGVICLEEFS